MPISNDPSRPRAPSTSNGTPGAGTQAGGVTPPPSSATPPKTGSPALPVPPGSPPKAELPELPKPPPSDGFHRDEVPILPRARVIVAGDAPVVLQPFEILIPDVKKLPSLEKLVERFGKDFAVMAHQIIHAPGQTAEQKAERLLQFFVAYAERFVEIVHLTNPGAQGGNAQDGQGKNLFKSDPELSKALRGMLESMREHGYEALKDALTGKTALTAGREMLTSTPRQFQELARAAQWVPAQTGPTDVPTRNPERVTLSEMPRVTETAAKAADARRPEDKLVPDKMKVAAWSAEAARMPVVMPKADADRARDQTEDPWAQAHRTNRRLGANMLWNVLHKLRGSEEDLAVNQEKWDRLTFAAILALAFLSVLVVLLVNL